MPPLSLDAYRQALCQLLKPSTLSPGPYTPSEDGKIGRHASVLRAGRPVVLCGPAGDASSLAQAQALAASPFAACVLSGPLQAGDTDAARIPWPDVTPWAIIAKPNGFAEDGTRSDRVIAVVLAAPAKAIAAALCITTETARAVDPNTPQLDDGVTLSLLARLASRPHPHIG